MSVSERAKDHMQQVKTQLGEQWEAFEDGAGRVVRGTVAGMLAGLIASWAMSQYEEIESRPVKLRKQEQLLSETPKAEPTFHAAQAEGDEATVKVAQAVSRKLFDHDLTDCQKQMAGPAVHFGYGAAAGALYGGLAEVAPTVGIGLGIPYATLLWLAGDEMAVPALGLSKLPTEVPAKSHASALATHFVYGITLDISRRILRRIL